jgi:hypothetical protein
MTVIQQTAIVTEEITSPELVLVSPPEIAAQAREALPDYSFEYENSVVRSRVAVPEAAAQAQEETAELSERPERTVADSLPSYEVADSLPSYELEQKWPWYELEPKPSDEPPEQRSRIRAFTFVFLLTVLSLISLVLFILYNR